MKLRTIIKKKENEKNEKNENEYENEYDHKNDNCEWVGTYEELHHHLLFECAERYITCPFYEYGCQAENLKI